MSPGTDMARSVSSAASAEPDLKRLVRVVMVPDRFVTGEGGALVNALNGKTPVPPGRKVLPSDYGIHDLPTLLSNAETYAQIAVLAMLGPDGYASTGTPDEPGTTLLTVGGSADRPAVVEVPFGLPLGEVLDLCSASPADGVLVGGYHGMWLPTDLAYDVPVSRAGLTAVGGTLGAGIVLPLGEGTCPLGEVARVVGYLAKESSGQCGPCKLGLPAIARALTRAGRRLGRCRRAGHRAPRRGRREGPRRVRPSRRGVPVRGVRHRRVHRRPDRAPVPRHLRAPGPGQSCRCRTRTARPGMSVDWTRCRGHGLCAHLVPEIAQLDGQGYPVFLDMPVPPWLMSEAQQAVQMCPTLAMRLVTPRPRPRLRRRRNPPSSSSRLKKAAAT